MLYNKAGLYIYLFWEHLSSFSPISLSKWIIKYNIPWVYKFKTLISGCERINPASCPTFFCIFFNASQNLTPFGWFLELLNWVIPVSMKWLIGRVQWYTDKKRSYLNIMPLVQSKAMAKLTNACSLTFLYIYIYSNRGRILLRFN